MSELDNSIPITLAMMRLYHNHNFPPHQCSSSVRKIIDAPLSLVWSLVRQFNKPQLYKVFVYSCIMHPGYSNNVGSIRDVLIVSGLPAKWSRERLDKLDDEEHVIKFSIIEGDHRLINYRSTMSVHEEEEDGKMKTVVIESFVVNVPMENNKDETCYFASAIIGLNLRALASVAEGIARKAGVVCEI